MNFEVTEEQKLIMETLKNFSLENLNDGIFEDDKNSVFRKDKWDLCCNMNVMGLPFPEEYGGLDKSMLTCALAIKSLATYCKDEGLIFSLVAQMSAVGVPLLFYGSDVQKNTYLRQIIAGEQIGAAGISEATAGSDISSIISCIRKVNEGYLVQGNKCFVTLAPYAQFVIFYAKHNQGISGLDISAVILDKKDFSIGQLYEKCGLRTSPISEVVVPEKRIMSEQILGKERLGNACFFKAMLWERILMSAYHIGVIEQQYHDILEYVKSRVQFGKKIIEFEGVYTKIIEMKQNLTTCNLMLLKTCWDFEQGKESMDAASMLKLHTSSCKLENSLMASTLSGAYGFMKENMVEKQLRDALAAKMYSGTDEIQRKIIAEEL